MSFLWSKGHWEWLYEPKGALVWKSPTSKEIKFDRASECENTTAHAEHSTFTFGMKKHQQCHCFEVSITADASPHAQSKMGNPVS